jgi:Calx-beta domain/Bacterial Ig-like domain (group 2)
MRVTRLHTGLAPSAPRLRLAVAAAALASVALLGNAPAASPGPSIRAPADLVAGEAEGHVDLTVTLSVPSSSPVSVHYATVDSSATAGPTCNSDYVGTSGTLNLAPFQTSGTVQVQILDCPNGEGFEAFRLSLSAPVNGVISRSSSEVGIVDNEDVVATPGIVARDAVVDEKDGFALVPVLLGGTGGEASNSTVTVDYTTVDGSASAGSDYTAQSGVLTFVPGQTAKTVAVPVADEAVREPPESFTLSLSNPAGATVARGEGTVTIGASDATSISQPRISAPFDIGVGEGVGFVDLAVKLSAPGRSPVSVAYTTQNLTAAAGSTCNNDYVAGSGTLNFAPGETSKAVRVDILDCPDVEGAETFRFLLSAPVNAVLDDAGAVITVADNDGTVVSLNSISVTPANPAIAGGADQPFAATGTFSDGHTEDLTATVAWASSSTSVATVTSAGIAHGVSGGSTTISAVKDGLTGSTNLAVGGLIAQTISFAVLPSKTYGDPAFPVSASASSGLDVSFTASGSCTVSNSTVRLTGAGSCTITASQPGDGAYGPATPVARTFSIAKASQAISFAPLAAKKVGNPDFTITASSSSGLPVAFTASGTCSVTQSAVLASQATVHLMGAGSCTITASQSGSGNFKAATSVARTFAIIPPARTCRVPKLVGRGLAKAKVLIALRHCRVGRVTRAYSRVRKTGVVIAQGKRAGRVLAAGTRISLVVSRGRKR